MKNSLLNRYLLSSYVASVLFMGTAGTATFFAKKTAQMAKAHTEKREIVDNCRTTCFLCVLIAAITLVMSVFCGVTYPQVVRKKAKIMTKHYLQDIFTRYPETRQYRSILENSEKLHEIAAVVCNGLTQDEQKEILRFVKEALAKSDDKHSISKIQKIEYMIIDVVQAHAAKDPEYMNKILYAIANTQNANFFGNAQKVR